MDTIKENNDNGLGWEGLLRGTLSAVNEGYDKAEGSYRDAAARYKEAIDGQVPLLQLMQQTMGRKKVVDEESMQKRRNVALLTDSLRTVGQLFNSAVGGNVVGYKPLDVESGIAKKRAEIEAFNDGYDRMAFQTAMQERQDGLKSRLNGINMDMKIGELQAERGKALQKAVQENAKLQRQFEKDARDYELKKIKTNAAVVRAMNSGSGNGRNEKEYADPFKAGVYHKERDARLVYADLYGRMLELDPNNDTGVREKLGGESGVTRPYADLDRVAMITKMLLRNPKFAGLAMEYGEDGVWHSLPNSPLRDESGIGDGVLNENKQRLGYRFPFQNKK